MRNDDSSTSLRTNTLYAFTFFFTIALAIAGVSSLTSCGSGGTTRGNIGTDPVVNASCPQVPLTMAVGPMTGVAAFPAPAPVPPPAPGSTSAGSVCVSTPSDGSSVSSPAHVQAVANISNPIDHMRVFVDGEATYFTFFNTVDALIWMAPGTHNLEVLATDKQGNNVSSIFQLSVTAPQNATITDIQNFPNWESCTALFAPGHPRAGQICAAGLGNAVSTMTEGQATPSLSGSSAKFTIGGDHGYSNDLWTKYLGGGRNVSHFVYDLYFMVDKPELPQALEFDVNQTFGNRRWVWGSECNFNDGAVWDVWDGVRGWQHTTVPCKPFPANTWIHLVWTLERSGEQVHYVSLAINDQVYNLDLYYSNQPGWTMEGIDVAFQMDLDGAHEPYNVWLDQVSLTAN